MYIFNRIFNNLVNKICWFLLICIVGLTCFFLGSYYVDASTCSDFVRNVNSSKFTLSTPISGTDDIYSHDKVRDRMPGLLHGQLDFVSTYGTFNNTYDFYQKFNYAVKQQNEVNYFRIYYQDFELLKTLSCGNLENKFYLYAVYTSINANSGYAYVQYGFMYNFYVDIHLDENNDIVVDSISTFNTDFPKFSTTTSSRFDRTPSWSYWSWNFPLIDSYNNFAIPYTIDDTLKADFFRGVGSFSIASYNSYPNETRLIHSESTPIDSLITHYTGDEVTEDTGGGESGGGESGGGDNSTLEEIRDTASDILDAIVDGTANIVTGIVDGVGDAIDGVVDGITGIYDWITEPFDGESTFGEFFEDFSDTDNGGISAIITSPLRLINSLLNDSSCESLMLPIFENQIPFPSGCMLWDKAPQSIISLWHTFICGLGSYFILTSLFKDIEKLKHPDESEVKTLDL